MFLAFSSVLISTLLVLLLKLVNFFIAEKSLQNRESMTAFECGFDTHSISRIPFSLRYFFLTLVFLLFDLEVVLLSFCPFIIFSHSYYLSLFVVFLFLIILLFSLFYELNDGTLEWVS